ncbi:MULTISPECIES: HAMP domain-containing sensor histidine kinase [unclassified Mucilaginibacter]|uniref:sensor histidine kinase n=1 Tax=unclassified Mucilaginibacter TaxID=2617802 RepID=UPI002AC9CE99|nr:MULTISPECIES: HAMP domain-containing sensor histidine kinase [unclassified Mucilaginibacter]MEB0260414.1 HAMP domain-containing sensor histidine kinase [Mucilaginibacter sp. 10I4]MEB0279994.1 HAMP domain-containing sensor histidine kinase [Mucilaginibacter sp. 10B2]MEB0302705.1 HAMP domain-containing sensor histidine kinase [Mucilaginibacter sp. 5C4]WPX23664.1 HAMP domain-containing sensor histidine kinase [Mucilaginibacter sp. 5C4]
MFVQISKEEYTKEISKKAWYQTNNIIWTIIFLYPIFSIVDFIYANNIWVQFLIVRIITVLIIYGLYSFFQARRYNYRTLLHISFFLLSITCAILCNVVNIQQQNTYYLIYATIILFFNLQVFWEPINSIIQTLAALLLLAIFYNLFSEYTLDLVISNGGQVFFIIAFISCLIPNARYKVIARDVRSQILIEKSNEQLKEQNQNINEKNNIIDRQYEQLRKLDDQKNSFINIAGHDLKNLIGSIVMSNNMLKEEDYRLSSDQKDYTSYIGESAEKMLYMLNKLMDVKEIESPEMKFNLEIFDINAEVNHVFRGLQETAQMKNIHLTDNILKLPLNVKLDKVFVGQIFQNLLSNAIKFSQTNNDIKVVSNLQRQKFVFEIIDEGVAIGQEELEMMFNKLKTLNDASGPMESRLGLGLSIAKLMTKELGGDLIYRSDDNGNYFRVEFYVIN